MNEWIDAEERIERAQQLCEAQQWAEALEQVDKALEIDDHNPSWWGSRAYLLDQLGRYEDAIDSYNKCLEQNETNEDVLVALGVDYIRTGQIMNAINTFERLECVNPQLEAAFCHRIMLYSELGEYELAEQMFYCAQQIREDCPHCFWHMGCSLSDREDLRRAIYCWQRVLEIEPRYRGARRRIADANRKIGDIPQAQEYYLAEYRENPADVNLLVEMGEMFAEHNHFEDAIRKFEQVLELCPEHVRAYTLLGDAYSQLNQNEKARAAYTIAVGIDDTRPGLRYKIGARLMSAGCFPEAQQVLDEELELQPDHPPTLMAAGNCALELGDAVRAQYYFERLIEVDDSVPGAFHNLGVCHFLKNDYLLGIQNCEKALELKDDYAMARHKLILAHMHLRNWRKARTMLDDSLSLFPEDEALSSLKSKIRVGKWTAWAHDMVDVVLRVFKRPAGEVPF